MIRELMNVFIMIQMETLAVEMVEMVDFSSTFYPSDTTIATTSAESRVMRR